MTTASTTTSSSSNPAAVRKMEVELEDQISPQKWRVPLKEDAFAAFMAKGNNSSSTAKRVFGDGSLFGPFLFGKFFDPSDAFPLWEFESDVLLSKMRSSGSRSTGVDWFQTDTDYVLKAELPAGKISVQLYVEKGKAMEISGRWRQQKDSDAKDWRFGRWWEHGFVRKLELPDNGDWRKMEAYLNDNDVSLLMEIRIPKKSLDGDDVTWENQGSAKDSESA